MRAHLAAAFYAHHPRVSGLAVAQPLLDLFGNNPEFFVAGNYSRAQIVGFALLIALVPRWSGSV